MKLAFTLLFTISLVVVTSTMVLAETAPGELSSDQFEDPLDRCQLCHAEIYSQWDGSMHSNAELDPYYRALSRMASEETDGLTDTYCARCHTPIGVVSGEVPPVNGSGLSDIAKKGVQCDFCHTVTGSDGTANAKFTLTPDGTKRGPFADSSSPTHGTEYSELHTKAEFCGMCHDVNHPTNGLPLEATYTEWKNGPYAARGIQCQDCHMTPGITEYQANPGKASGIGKDREHIWTHFGVGGNAFITEYMGSKTHRDMAVERLQRAAEVKIVPQTPIRKGDEFMFDVKIRNVGAGHYIPTGLTESRQMWLEVTVTDDGGEVLYHSGGMDGHGDPQAVIYHTVIGDAQGNPTEKVWEAQSILSDNRIPPGGHTTESFSLMLPEDAKTPINITATLKYRSAPQHLIDELFGEGEMDVPVIEMTEESLGLGEGYEQGPAFVISLPMVLGFILLVYSMRKPEDE